MKDNLQATRFANKGIDFVAILAILGCKFYYRFLGNLLSNLYNEMQKQYFANKYKNRSIKLKRK